MKIDIQTHDCMLSEALRTHTTAKITQAVNHLSSNIDVGVRLVLLKGSHYASARFRIGGKDLYCEASHDDMYAAVDLLADKVTACGMRAKGKVQSHSSETIKHYPAEIEG